MAKFFPYAAAIDPILVDIISYYKFEAAAGSNRLDSSPNNLHLSESVPSAVGQATGKIGNAALFDDDRLLHVYNSLYNFSSSNLTLIFWAYRTGTPIHRMVVLGTNPGTVAANTCFDVYTIGANTVFRISDGTTRSSIARGLITLNTWQMIACRWTHSTKRLEISIDGGSSWAATITSHTIQTLGDQAFSVGNSPNDGSEGFQGRGDEMGFWKRALTDAEVIYMYNSGAGRQLY